METKTALLDAAEGLVRAGGINGFSYADISNSVGIRKASIHYHFPKKSDLTSEVLRRYSDRFLTELLQIGDQSATAGEAIAAYLAAYRAALQDGRSVCLCVSFSLDRDMLDDAARDTLNTFYRASLFWLTKQFRRAQADGSIANLAAPKDEAFACLALVEGAQVMARAQGAVAPFNHAVRSFENRLN